MKNWLFYIFMGITGISVQARIINVPSEFSTIQAGIDASISGDTVLVASGEYTENAVIQDKNILLSSAEGPTVTVIHGNFSIIGASIDTSCILRGFELNGAGIGGGWPDCMVYIENGSPVILGNIIEDNDNSWAGAGVFSQESGVIIRGNIIRDNWSCSYGAGVAAIRNDTTHSRQAVIEGNIISGNKAGTCINDQGDAAGIYVAKGIVRYNLIINNYAYRNALHSAFGGGLASFSFHSQIYNNTIVGNGAIGRWPSGHGGGGGMYIALEQPDSTAFIKNNILAFNPWGGGVFFQRVDSLVINWDYNLLFGNDTADYVGIQPGPHDIQVNPMLVDTANGDFHLQRNSPCIDSGDPSFPLDPDGTRCDIGAYYFDHYDDIDEDGTPTGPYNFALEQNYPNPFNSQTIISYNLDKEAIVSLHIYSITGHLVSTLMDGEKQREGEYKYTWKGRNEKGQSVSTGIYFYELCVEGKKESKAMIMVR